MDSQKLFCIFFFILFTIIGNCLIECTEDLREKYITSVQDGRLKFNESVNLEDLKNPHGFLNLRNSLNSDIDLEDALQDFHIINAITSSINQWKLKKHLKNFSNSTKKRVKRDEEVVCYRNFGCFRDEGPFDYLDTLPASPDTINTTFTLFTREEKNGESLNYLNSTTITNSKISTDRPIKIIIHGFGSSGKRPWVVQMTEALIYMEDVNVIVVDWEAGAALPNYVQAAANTQLVGKQIARLINTINQNLKFKPEDYHLIGFSLGAHIAGFAGAEIKNISRITGLDPASPLFEGYSVRARLDPSDAKFVDVIHSNGDSFLKGGFGSFKPMGHLDFYPNGGRVQVGCNSVFVGAITDIFYGKWQSLCHHRRAFRFFIDSLVPSCRFHAFACDSYEKFLKGECFNCGESGRRCANMGYYAGFSKGRGKMYLMTRNKEPFCANQYKIRILSSNTQHSTWGKLEISFISKDANETFPLTSESDEIKDKAILQGLVVAHPIIRNITHVSLKYTKYRGWIYSGKDFWAVDKIILQNSDGEVFSYCGSNTIIQNNESVLLDLERTNCTLFEPSNDLPTARVARLIWKVVSKPVRPSFFWRLTEYNPITKLNHNSNSNSLGSNTINYNSFNLNSGVHSINPNLINSSNQNKPYLAFMNSNLNQLNNLNKVKNNPTTTLRHSMPLTSITTTTTSSKNDTPKNLFYKTTDRTNSQINNNQLQNDVDSNEKQNTQFLQQVLQSHQQINLEEDININTFNSTTQSNQSNSSLINLAINLPTKNISSTTSFE